MKPPVVYTRPTGKEVYWCIRREQQVIEEVCHKQFKKQNKDCQTCLDKPKKTHWPEPWASLGGNES